MIQSRSHAITIIASARKHLAELRIRGKKLVTLKGEVESLDRQLSRARTDQEEDEIQARIGTAERHLNRLIDEANEHLRRFLDLGNKVAASPFATLASPLLKEMENESYWLKELER